MLRAVTGRTIVVRWKMPCFLMVVLSVWSLGTGAFAGEFPVATYTFQRQIADGVAFNPVSGEFVAIWTSDGGPGSDDWDFSIQARRFDSAGAPVGDQFQVNSLTAARQDYADLVVDNASGHFMVVWSHRQPASSAFRDLRGRLFASDGTPLSGDFQVTQGTQNRAFSPAVESLPSGDFIVSWLDANGEDTHAFVRRYAGDGTPMGSAFQVNQEPLYIHLGPRTAVDASTGQFLVVWSDPRPGEAEWQIEARAFTSTGVPLGDTFVVAGMTTADFRNPDVAFEPQSETFVVAWNDFSELDGDEWGVMMRRVLADGTLLGDPTLVNTTTARDQAWPKVMTQSTGGEFEIAWSSETKPGSTAFQNNVRARRFTSEGTPLGADYRAGEFDRPAAGMSIAGTMPTPQEVGSNPQPFLIWSVWMPCGDNSEWGVTAFYAPAATDFCALGADGFESGDFIGWSTVVGQ